MPVMQHVKSSNVHSVGHDGDHSYVTFKNKDGKPVSTYRYDTVPEDKHAELAGAESVRKHLNEHFIGRHAATKLDDILTPPEAAE